ncbi:MAG TPA: UDP-4-amino-4,6-dideoxy-N-acetyl-beta-L-altrosamine transaminase [Clostridiaceae bacterium]|nr:UDP-4-amino-4,6-dideoxy-N-acetyl-beta-L-altrosamine transaminase [Clostridiaceae bacterium]
MIIPYGRQWIEEDDIQAVVETLQSDYLTTGPKVSEFEEKLAKYVGAKYAVAVSNGTAALHIACLAAGIGEGDEVITTPITFAASSNCVLYCGGKTVFADIDPKTYNIDPNDMQRKITKKTKAIIPVHFSGQPCDMDAIHQIAKEHNLIVIEDAAHAIGAEYKGKKIGGLSDMTEFSFHPVKHLTTGEGGAITTNSEELYQKLLLFRTHGITRNKELMSEFEGGWYYQQLELGFNYRITDIQSALGISQLNKLDRSISRRREIAMKYNEAFKNIEGLVIPYQAPDTFNSYHLYVLQFTGVDRKQAYDKLRSAGIMVNVHYIPTYTFPYYRQNGYQDTFCQNAEQLYQNIISIPMYYGLTEEQIDYVIENVIKVATGK